MELTADMKAALEKSMKAYLEDYYEKNASDALREKVKAEGKTIEGAYKYIESVARKFAKANVCAMPDDVAYGLLMHYLEDEAEGTIFRTAEEIEADIRRKEEAAKRKEEEAKRKAEEAEKKAAEAAAKKAAKAAKKAEEAARKAELKAIEHAKELKRKAEEANKDALIPTTEADLAAAESAAAAQDAREEALKAKLEAKQLKRQKAKAKTAANIFNFTQTYLFDF